MPKDNYETFKEQGRERFLTYDQDAIIRSFSLKHDDTYIYLNFLGEAFCIERATGAVLYADDHARTVYMDEAMTIYDILTKTEGGTPQLANEWVTLQQLGGIIATGHLQRLDQGSPFVEQLRGKTAELESACLALGGKKQRKGDVSYVLPIFDFFPVWLQFWDGDEEFPPNLQYLWDKHTPQFLHYETQWYLMNAMERRIKALLPDSRH